MAEDLKEEIFRMKLGAVCVPKVMVKRPRRGTMTEMENMERY